MLTYCDFSAGARKRRRRASIQLGRGQVVRRQALQDLTKLAFWRTILHPYPRLGVGNWSYRLSFDAPDIAPDTSVKPASAPPAKRRRRDPRRSHGRAKLLTLDRLDKRTAAAQRAMALVRSFTTDMGGADRLSEGAKQLVQRAAVLGTFIESVEVRWLRGEPIELLDLLAAINAQRRCIETIGAAARQARDITTITPLEYAKRRDLEKEAAA